MSYLPEPEILPKYRIWQYTTFGEPLSDDPRVINYKTELLLKLQPEYTFESGYLIGVDYYSEYENEESLILTVEIDYDAGTKTRTTTRKYVLENGEFGDLVKGGELGIKRYTDSTWETVQMRRRENIVNGLTAQASQFGILSFVQTLWRNLNDELAAYISTGDTSLIEDITKYNGQWLDSPSSIPDFTLRQIIIAELSI